MRSSPRTSAALSAAAAALIAAGMLLLALWYGDGATRESLPGLPDPGLTGWLLPAARLGMQAGAVATIGLLLAAVVLSPRGTRTISAAGYRRLRPARWAALLWGLCALLTFVLTLADLLAAPVRDVLSPPIVGNFATAVPLGRAYALSTLLALTVAVVCATSLTATGGAVALGLAVTAVVPPIFTGHAAAGGNHQVAISALILHVVPVTIWAGGLLALLLTGRGPAAHLPEAVRRFSPLAAWSLAAVTVSGLASAAARLPNAGAVLDSRYGQIMLAKGLILAGLGAAGWWQRRAALPAVRAGDRRRFFVTATVEVLLFGAALGAAVALSRTPPPVGEDEETPAQSLLGFPMPDAPSAATLAGNWLPEPLFLTAAICAAGLYLAGVLRLRRRGDAWPASRVALFLAGCALLAVATSSGLARYAPVLFSVHMAQHLLLNMVVPILLVLAAPVTLALRALTPATDPAWPGPREWIQATLHSRLLRFLSHPLVATALYAGSLFVLYFTGLYELALRSHAAHLAMIAHFLVTGYLFFWVVIGVDPAPRRAVYPLRMVLILIAMAVHAFLGVALMMSTAVLAPDWVSALDRPWGPTPLEDQRTGGGLAWSFGEIPMAGVMLALLVQWMRADEREARRRDRAADRAIAEGREDAELAAYNTMLAELAARDRRAAEARTEEH